VIIQTYFTIQQGATVGGFRFQVFRDPIDKGWTDCLLLKCMLRDGGLPSHQEAEKAKNAKETEWYSNSSQECMSFSVVKLAGCIASL